MIDPNYFQAFRLGKLWYRYIKGTQLEAQGWTTERLAQALKEAGCIKLVTIQGQGPDGRFRPGETRYIELPGKHLSRSKLVSMLSNKRGIKCCSK